MWAKTWAAARIVENYGISIKIKTRMQMLLLSLETWSIARTKPLLSIKTCSTKLTLATTTIMDDRQTTAEITWRRTRQKRKIIKEVRVRSPVASTLKCTPSSRQQSLRILMAAGTITTSNLCPGCNDAWTFLLSHATRWKSKATVCLTRSWWH